MDLLEKEFKKNFWLLLEKEVQTSMSEDKRRSFFNEFKKCHESFIGRMNLEQMDSFVKDALVFLEKKQKEDEENEKLYNESMQL